MKDIYGCPSNPKAKPPQFYLSQIVKKTCQFTVVEGRRVQNTNNTEKVGTSRHPSNVRFSTWTWDIRSGTTTSVAPGRHLIDHFWPVLRFIIDSARSLFFLPDFAVHIFGHPKRYNDFCSNSTINLLNQLTNQKSDRSHNFKLQKLQWETKQIRIVRNIEQETQHTDEIYSFR